MQNKQLDERAEVARGVHAATNGHASAPQVPDDHVPDDDDEILLPPPKRTPVNVKVVSRDKPPLVFHEDELECEDEILLPPRRMTYGVGHVVSREKPPFVFRDDLED